MRSLFILVLLAACTTGPHNGTVFEGPTLNKHLTFEGYTNKPADKILLQVLTNAGADPTNEANWTVIGSAVTVSAPTQVNASSTPLYSWSTVVTPVPSAAQQARWPTGGLVRIRATRTTTNGRTILTTFDVVTFSDCLNSTFSAGDDWMTIGQECTGTGEDVTTLVSGANAPTTLVNGGFLNKKGPGSPSQTLLYYLAIGAPPSLTAFRTKYQFQLGDVSATYYNDGDLGVGREMHCKLYGLALACYVANYSATPEVNHFDDDPVAALAQATSGALSGVHKGAFATVAMVWDPLAAQQVSFVVYDKAGNWALEAPLDNNAADNKSIPNNCLSCHGINSSFTSGVVKNAKFLPFDPFSFKFSTMSQFTFAAQAGKLRQLNALVEVTNPTPATKELIEGMYAPLGVSNPAAVANNSFVPDDWKNMNGSLAGTALYNGVFKVGCRSCHVSATNLLDFRKSSDFSNQIGTIMSEVCDPSHRVMPHAQRTMEKFWDSGARAYLTSAYKPATYASPNDVQWRCAP